MIAALGKEWSIFQHLPARHSAFANAKQTGYTRALAIDGRVECAPVFPLRKNL
jgi:hypothetical protein